MEKLSIKSCIAYGWKTFWSRPWLFVLAGVITFGVNAIFSIPQEILDSASNAATGSAAMQLALFSLVFGIIGFIVSVYIQMGTMHFTLKAHDDIATTSVRDLLMLKGFWRYLGVSVLVFLAVLAGLILLIVPGIILALALSFATYLVIDKGLGPISAFKESMAITKGNRWNLFVLGLAICGLNILGLLALVVGLIVTIPVSMLASVHAYRLLSGSRTASTDAEIVIEPVTETATA